MEIKDKTLLGDLYENTVLKTRWLNHIIEKQLVERSLIEFQHLLKKDVDINE